MMPSVWIPAAKTLRREICLLSRTTPSPKRHSRYRPRRSIDRNAYGLHHLGPDFDFAFKVVRRFHPILEDRIEADSFDLLPRVCLAHQRIDLRIELHDHRIGRPGWREETNPGAGIDIRPTH